jgi:peptidoglycan L-alanyl-D-glutamate endopeptidase CwlK
MPDQTMPARPQSNGYTFGSVSEAKLVGVHPDLVRLVRRALAFSHIDFGVHEGARTLEQQKEYLAKKLSTTLKSRHIPMPVKAGGNGFAHAIDVHPWVNGIARWDGPLFIEIDKAFDLASKELKIPYEWGGRWRSFPDGPHFQLPWNLYPPDKPVILNQTESV